MSHYKIIGNMKIVTKNNKKSSDGFRYRGLKSSRLETLTDTIFGFAITLLIISSEVPKNYVELQASMYGFLGFIFCTLLIMTIWNSHKTYFIRYGLQDTRTYVLNTILVFVLLFYIYPLKYLFSYIGTAIYVKIKLAFGDTSQGLQLAIQRLKEANLDVEQWSDILLRFSLALAVIYSLFILLHLNAFSKKKALKLNHKERYLVKTSIQEYGIFLGITLFSIVIVVIFGNACFMYWSLSYLLIPILIPIHQKIRKKRYKRFKKQRKLSEKGCNKSALNEEEENTTTNETDVKTIK